MMDALKVRFPCTHGRGFRHIIDSTPGRPFTWCDGGTTRHLLQERPFDWNGSEDRWVWVEVTP